MKKIDLKMIPVEDAIIPLMKENIKRLGQKMTLGQYIAYTAAMHSRVLDGTEAMKKEAKDEQDDSSK